MGALRLGSGQDSRRPGVVATLPVDLSRKRWLNQCNAPSGGSRSLTIRLSRARADPLRGASGSPDRAGDVSLRRIRRESRRARSRLPGLTSRARSRSAAPCMCARSAGKDRLRRAQSNRTSVWCRASVRILRQGPEVSDLGHQQTVVGRSEAVVNAAGYKKRSRIPPSRASGQFHIVQITAGPPAELLGKKQLTIARPGREKTSDAFPKRTNEFLRHGEPRPRGGACTSRRSNKRRWTEVSRHRALTTAPPGGKKRDDARSKWTNTGNGPEDQDARPTVQSTSDRGKFFLSQSIDCTDRGGICTTLPTPAEDVVISLEPWTDGL